MLYRQHNTAQKSGRHRQVVAVDAFLFGTFRPRRRLYRPFTPSIANGFPTIIYVTWCRSTRGPNPAFPISYEYFVFGLFVPDDFRCRVMKVEHIHVKHRYTDRAYIENESFMPPDPISSYPFFNFLHHRSYHSRSVMKSSSLLVCPPGTSFCGPSRDGCGTRL